VTPARLAANRVNGRGDEDERPLAKSGRPVRGDPEWLGERVDGGIRQANGERHDQHALAEDHLICPIGVPIRHRIGHAGQELAPASTAMVDRLLWRRRARPSATLDKMRTEL
jgi:hypothetical protein